MTASTAPATSRDQKLHVIAFLKEGKYAAAQIEEHREQECENSIPVQHDEVEQGGYKHAERNDDVCHAGRDGAAVRSYLQVLSRILCRSDIRILPVRGSQGSRASGGISEHHQSNLHRYILLSSVLPSAQVSFWQLLPSCRLPRSPAYPYSLSGQPFRVCCVLFQAGYCCSAFSSLDSLTSSASGRFLRTGFLAGAFSAIGAVSTAGRGRFLRTGFLAGSSASASGTFTGALFRRSRFFP